MSRRLYIPKLGDYIQLAEDWTFPLHIEGRNSSLWNVMEIEPPSYWNGWKFADEAEAKADATYQEFAAHPDINLKVKIVENAYRGQNYQVEATLNVTFPAGTILKMDRLYIRKNAREFDSVTFVVEQTSLFKGRKPRFWAKLEDANRMVLEDTNAVAIPSPKRSEPKVAYRVTAASAPYRADSRIDAMQRTVHSAYRTSKFDDDEKFLKRAIREFGEENIVAIHKSHNGLNNWKTKWELLLENPEIEPIVRQEQAAYQAALHNFFKEEYEKIKDKYGHVMNVSVMRGYGRATLEEFERWYVNTGHVAV